MSLAHAFEIAGRGKKNSAPEVGDHWTRMSDGRTLLIQKLLPDYAAGVYLEKLEELDDEDVVIPECAGGVLMRNLSDPTKFRLAKRK